MISSKFVEGTNKKAFSITDGTNEIMVTYATPALIKTNDKVTRLWNSWRPNSGKHILHYDKTLTKKIWNEMEVGSAVCTGRFLQDCNNKVVVLKFKKDEVLVVNGTVLMIRKGKTLYRPSNNLKTKSTYEKYFNAFTEDKFEMSSWNSLEVCEDLKFI